MRKLLLASAILLTACSSLPEWMGAGEDKAPLPGERISVIDSSINLSPDAETAAQQIALVGADINFDHYQTYNIGEPAADTYVINNSPVIADGKLFAIDGTGNVVAYKLDGMQKLWANKPTGSKDDRHLPGGGIAYAFGVVYATRGNGDIVAISAENGTEIWKKNLGAAIRKDPAVGDEKVFAATADNQLFALSVVDGSTVWRHSGSNEATINYGSPAPAIKEGTVVIAYSSGEIFGLSSLRGSELWAETISTGTERRKTAAIFVDVSATPLMVDGMSYIASQNGSLISYNTGNGYRVWEQKIGSVEYTPAIADKFIFAIGDNTRLVALNRNDGKIKWLADLPPKADKKDTEKWAGPVIAGSKIIAASSTGRMAVYDLNDGKLTGIKDIPAGTFALPIVDSGKLYLFTKDASLAVF